MFRRFIFGHITECYTQKLILFIIICALSIECGFQEPETSTILQEEEKQPFPNQMNIDAYTLHKINSIIQTISNKKDLTQSERFSMISARFLGTPYQSNRLHGSDKDNENLVIDFRGLDCFTYLDYVTALYISHSQNEFIKNIIKIRYIDNNISFSNRRHFFTDWVHRDEKIAEDITIQITPNIKSHTKFLNEQSMEKLYLPGIPVISRKINFIPGFEIDNNLIKKLKSGDLIGIYTPLPGLDVSHVGLFIITDKGPVFRHASSRKESMRVIDSPFLPYISKTPGIVVLRLRQFITLK